MGESMAVLHVDDEPGFSEMVAEFLEREYDRFTVERARSASDGLDRLVENGFDCIVSDYEMPEMNGIEFLSAVRDRYSNLPFILITGKGSEEVASEAITGGASDYIQKQSGTEQYRLLANRVRNLVEKYRSQVAVERSEQRYHNLVDTAPIPILLFDTDGELVYANQAAVDFLHADSHFQLEGRPFSDFLHHEDRSTAQQRFERLMSEESPAPEIEYRVRTVDGEFKHATVATAYGYYTDEKVAQAMIHH
jgi:PAS domain S-box-containing protein